MRTIEPTLPTPRTATFREKVSVVDGIAIDRVRYGGVVDLPPKEAGCFLVVSLMVAQAAPDRNDLLVPGEVVRDQAGNIVGCKGLSRAVSNGDDSPSLEARLTAAVRHADVVFETVGGSSRHYVRDCLLPALEEAKLQVKGIP